MDYINLIETQPDNTSFVYDLVGALYYNGYEKEEIKHFIYENTIATERAIYEAVGDFFGS